ncbi:MAG: RNA methyltransferase [Bacteroidales bacterium]|nr:RNA methyltransferase [Clostridium sp.]MCM1204633.1 RNA methyltransferase [Bacteroidales bacterium]
MITSTANKQIKNVIKCRKSARERRKQDVFLVEGIRMFSELPGELRLETFVTETFYDNHRELFNGIVFELVAEHVMEAMADTKTPQGVVCLARQQHYSAEEVCSGDNPLVIALENIQDPGNLGSIIRTAEGAGVTGILMSEDTVDVYNPKVVRATMGSIFRLPFTYVRNMVQYIVTCNKNKFKSYSAHLDGESFYDYNYTVPTIFCIGNEGKGLSQELSDTTTQKIKIPMMGKVESLNAATASTVLMYEAMRQRKSSLRQN